jgi:tetratricopeptide (TPR) repeat protein
LSITDPSGKLVALQQPELIELAGYLVLSKNDVLSHETVGSALWPELDSEAAETRFAQTMAALKKELPEFPIRTVRKKNIELLREKLIIDSDVVDARVQWLRTLKLVDRQEASRQLWDLIQPGLLPEVASGWIRSERTRYQVLARQLEAEFSRTADSRPAIFRFGDDFGASRLDLRGRQQELLDIGEWLQGGRPQSLFLAGPPGVGKTRLLREVLISDCGDVDAIISLSTVQSTEAPWLERIGQATGIRGEQQITEALTRLLQGFRLPLLALDDFDQSTEETQEWIRTLSVAVPNLRILATVRKRPEDEEATILEVKPLQTQAANSDVAVEFLTSFAALFGVKGKILEESTESLSNIATHLEGLPLALEVAAGWLPFMRPERLLRMLQEKPEIVVERASSDHASLVDCIRLMLSTVPQDERRALTMLSVCRGGVGEDLVEAMIGPDWPWPVRALTERSLAQNSSEEFGSRYVVLQAIRDSVRIIESGEELELATSAHTRACLELGKKAGWETGEGDRKKWLGWLKEDGDNLLAACERCLLGRSEDVTAIEIIDELRNPFWIIGRTGEFRRVRALAFEIFGQEHPDIDARTPTALARHRIEEQRRSGHLEEAVRLSQLFRRAVEVGDDEIKLAHALDFEGESLFRCGDYPPAIDCFLRASQIYLSTGRRRHALWLEAKIAHVQEAMGIKGEPLLRRQRSLQTAIEVQDFNSAGMYSKEFAKDAMRLGHWQEANVLATRAVEAFRNAGEVLTVFDALLVLSATQIALNDREWAQTTIHEASLVAPIYDERRMKDLILLRNMASAPPAPSDGSYLLGIDSYA